MAETGAPGVVAAAGSTGEIAQETQKAAANNPQNAGGLANPQAMSGQGAQFVFVAAGADQPAGKLFIGYYHLRICDPDS